MTDKAEVRTEVLVETDNYMVWVSEEPDGEVAYHIELGPVTIHFFREEWNEFLALMTGVLSEKSGR